MYLLRGAIWEAGLTRNAPGKARSAARQPAARMLPVRGSVGGRKESFSRWWTHAMLPPRGAHTGVDRNARARNLTYTHRHPFDAATRARRVTPLRARSRAPWRVGAVAVESSTLGEQHPLAVARPPRATPNGPNGPMVFFSAQPTPYWPGTMGAAAPTRSARATTYPPRVGAAGGKKREPPAAAP